MEKAKLNYLTQVAHDLSAAKIEYLEKYALAVKLTELAVLEPSACVDESIKKIMDLEMQTAMAEAMLAATQIMEVIAKWNASHIS